MNCLRQTLKLGLLQLGHDNFIASFYRSESVAIERQFRITSSNWFVIFGVRLQFCDAVTVLPRFVAALSATLNE